MSTESRSAITEITNHISKSELTPEELCKLFTKNLPVDGRLDVAVPMTHRKELIQTIDTETKNVVVSTTNSSAKGFTMLNDFTFYDNVSQNKNSIKHVNQNKRICLNQLF